MNIGLLNAFTPAEEETFGAREIDAFQALLRPVAPAWTLVEYRVTEGDLPASAAACDGWLISGSPQGVYDNHPWIGRLSAFIQAAFQAGRPLVGICFGHQILAHALGGRAEKSAQGWGIGLYPIDLIDPPAWLDPRLEQLALYYCHQDQVTALPPGARRLGGDSRCPNALFAINRRVLGIQGHPEFSPPFMSGLIERMRPRVGQEAADRAQTSLTAGQPANAGIARSIVNFFTAT